MAELKVWQTLPVKAASYSNIRDYYGKFKRKKSKDL